MPKIREYDEDDDDIEDLAFPFHERPMTLEEVDEFIKRYCSVEPSRKSIEEPDKILCKSKVNLMTSDEFVEKHSIGLSSKIGGTETHRESKVEKDEISSETEFERFYIADIAQEVLSRFFEGEKSSCIIRNSYDSDSRENLVLDVEHSTESELPSLLSKYADMIQNGDATGFEQLHLRTHNHLPETPHLEKLDSGNCIGISSLYDKIGRFSSVLEKGYQGETGIDQGASGWANPELLHTLYEMIGGSLDGKTNGEIIVDIPQKIEPEWIKRIIPAMKFKVL
ncbi:MAG: hypothetical protein ACTSUO_01670 [Candidatus Thorarchaeota archaeon]